MNQDSITFETLSDQVFFGMLGETVALNSLTASPSEIISKTFEKLIHQVDACVNLLQPSFSSRPSATIYSQESSSDGMKLHFQVGYFCSVKEYQTLFHTNDKLKQLFTSKGIQWLSIPGGHYAKATHLGNYNTLTDHWMQFMGKLEQQQVLADWNNWTNWEWNIKAAREVSDSNQYITELWQRIMK